MGDLPPPEYTLESSGQRSVLRIQRLPNSTNVAIGIDFGTSCCRMASWNGSDVQILKYANQGTLLSCICFTYKGSTEGGVRSQDSVPDLMLSGAAIFNCKRLIGRVDTDPVVSASKSLPFLVQTLGVGVRPLIAALIHNTWRSTTPEEVLALLFTVVRANVERQLRRSIKNVSVTVPASFSRFQRARITDACAKAGLRVYAMMSEPAAVSLLYAQQQQQLQAMQESRSEKIALIFNMGAGYCDVAITSVSNGKSELKALSGSATGGEDLLQNMMRHLVPEYDILFSTCGTWEIKAMALLRLATQSAIHRLSFEPTAEVNIDLGNGIQVSKIVKRGEFEDVNREEFERCESLVRQCLYDAKVEAEDLADVILAGGCTVIPKVRNLVSVICKTREDEFYGRIHPIEAAVRGVALRGASNVGLRSIEVTPLSIGIKADNNSFVPIIPKNTTLPVQRGLTFTTTHDDQEEALIFVYEGEENKIKEDLRLLGYFKLSGIPPAARGVPKVVVRMYVDVTNKLIVAAACMHPGSQIVGPCMEVEMPTVEYGDEWGAEVVNRWFRSTRDLATVQTNSEP